MKLSHSTFLLLITFVIVTFINGLDSSIVNICLTILAETFHVDIESISWVTLSYLLFIAGTTLIFGILASKRNLKKKIFIIG